MSTLMDVNTIGVTGEKPRSLRHESLPLLAATVFFADSIIWSASHVAAVLILGSVLLFVFFIRSFYDGFKYRRGPIYLLALCCLLHLINRFTLQIHVISLSLLVGFYFALAGCYVNSGDWRKLQLPTLLTLLLFPLFDYLAVYLGFPLRLLSANIASDLLAALHFPVFSDSDLLFVENRYLQVDIDCSGSKGLWTGLVFYTALSWIYKRHINIQWLVSLILFIYCLIVFNAIRIATITWIDLILKKPDLAASLHESIGLMGFVLACLIAWFLIALPRIKPDRLGFEKVQAARNILNRYIEVIELPARLSKWIYHRFDSSLAQKWTSANRLGILFLVFAVPGLVAQPNEIATNATVSSPTMQFPLGWASFPVALNDQEKLFFAGKQVAIDKIGFKHGTIEGSMILVSSKIWKTQHHPKHCLQAQGFSVIQDQSTLLANAMRIRQLTLLKNNQSYTALFWWQSADTQTDDYGRRVFSSMTHPSKSWTMISLLIKNELTQYEIVDIAGIIKPQITQYYRLQHANQPQSFSL